jgi:hypothetical protein
VTRNRIAILVALGAAVPLAGAACISVPSVVVVDRKTALELQVAGEYPASATASTTDGMSPGATPLSRGALLAAGAESRAGFDGLTEPWTVFRADADLVDDLLARRCVGGSFDGQLAERGETCVGEVDAAALAGLIQRTNRAREQVWRWLASKAPGSDEQRVRTAWRQVHLDEVPCGAPVQAAGGRWEVRSCD